MRLRRGTCCRSSGHSGRIKGSAEISGNVYAVVCCTSVESCIAVWMGVIYIPIVGTWRRLRVLRSDVA